MTGKALLSRPLAVADIPPRGLDVEIEADKSELEEIASEFGLAAIEALTATYHARQAAGGVHVEGEVKARLRQICVVSLEPFDVELEEPVDLAFAPQARRKDAGGEIVIGLDDEDPPEPIIGGKIDLGAVTLEFLALGLDPHPRKPGVALPRENAVEQRPPSPFADLAGLIDKKKPRK